MFSVSPFNNRISRKLTRSLLVLTPAALLILGGCGTASQTTTGTAAGTNAATTKTDTPQAYKANCISCHGTDLQGRMGPATNLTKVGNRLSKDQIMKQIKQGGGGMPAFTGRLSDAEIDSLSSWLSGHK